MSKAAARRPGQGLARDLGPRGITVNNIQPGPIDTDMNPADGDFAAMLRKLMALPRYGTRRRDRRHGRLPRRAGGGVRHRRQPDDRRGLHRVGGRVTFRQSEFLKVKRGRIRICCQRALRGASPEYWHRDSPVQPASR